MFGLTIFAPLTVERPARGPERDRLALRGAGLLHELDVVRRPLRGQHVVLQDLLQLRLVLGEAGEDVRRHLGERLVRRREDGVRAGALHHADELGVGEQLGQGLEAAGGDGRVHDVLRLGEGGARQPHDEDGHGRQQELLSHGRLLSNRVGPGNRGKVSAVRRPAYDGRHARAARPFTRSRNGLH